MKKQLPKSILMIIDHFVTKCDICFRVQIDTDVELVHETQPQAANYFRLPPKCLVCSSCSEDIDLNYDLESSADLFVKIRINIQNL